MKLFKVKAQTDKHFVSLGSKLFLNQSLILWVIFYNLDSGQVVFLKAADAFRNMTFL